MTTPHGRRAANALLRTFAQDLPSAKAKTNTLFALGAGAPASIAGEAAVRAAELPAAASKHIPTAASALKMAVIKAALVGAVCGGATVEGARYLSRARVEPTKEIAVPKVASVRPAQEELPPMVDEADAPREGSGRVAPANDPLSASPPSITREGSPKPRTSTRGRDPEAKAVAVGPAAMGASPEAPVEAAAPPSVATASAGTAVLQPLTAEIMLLDAARAATLNGDPARAMQKLDRYRSDFPAGSLNEEASVLRIEVLVRLGDVTKAERLAREFAASHPTSSHLLKIGAILSKRSQR